MVEERRGEKTSETCSQLMRALFNEEEERNNVAKGKVAVSAYGDDKTIMLARNETYQGRVRWKEVHVGIAVELREHGPG
jgi:hypothetical protein